MAKFVDPDSLSAGQSTFVDPDEARGQVSGISRVAAGEQERKQRKDFGLRNRIAFNYDLTPDQIDTTTGAKAFDRIDYSFSDTDEEIIKKFREKYPKGLIQRIVMPEETKMRKSKGKERRVRTKDAESMLLFKYDANDPDEKLTSIEDYGRVTGGDVADLTAAVPEVAAAVGLSLAFPPSAGWQAAALGLGTAGAHVAKEGIEETRGMQLQPWSEVMKTAGIKGGIAAGFGYGGNLLMKPVNVGAGRGLLHVPEESRVAVQRIEEANLPLTQLGAHQIGKQHPILSGKAAQAFSTSAKGQTALVGQVKSAVTALEGLEGATKRQLGRKLVQIASPKYWKRKWGITGGKISAEKGGVSLQNAAKSFSQKSRADVGKLYDKVDDVANIEQPIFDLSKAGKQVQSIKQAILADVPDEQIAGRLPERMGGHATTETRPGAPLNVADTPRGQLLSVIEDIERASTQQSGYETVKNLRTRLFNLIDNEAWQWDVNKYYASKLWGELTNTLTSGKGSFPKVFKAASSAHRARMDVLNMSNFQRITKAELPVDLANQYSRPGGMPRELASAFREYSPKHFNRFRQYARFRLLEEEGGAVNAINNFTLKDPEGFRRIATKLEEKTLRKTASKLDALNSERVANVAKRQLDYDAVVDDLITKQNPAGINKLLIEFGGKNSEGGKALRRSVLKHVIKKSVHESEEGFKVVDKTKIRELLGELDESGALNLLTKADRKRLLAIKDYVRLVGLDADVGVSLQKQAAVGMISHPGKYPTMFRTFGVNEVISRLMMNKTVTRVLVGAGRKELPSAPMQRMSAVIGILYDDMEAGQQGLKKAKREEKKRSIEALGAY